jgi:hypothetical protein
MEDEVRFRVFSAYTEISRKGAMMDAKAGFLMLGMQCFFAQRSL